MKYLLFFICASTLAFADTPTTPPAPSTPAPASAEGPILYELDDLKLENIAQYDVNAKTILRQFLQFKTADESHFILYDESTAITPLRDLENLKNAAKNSNCRLDIQCKAKAFCTNGCQHMFYEMTNAAPDPAFPERNNCTLKYFSCGSPAAKTFPPITSSINSDGTGL